MEKSLGAALQRVADKARGARPVSPQDYAPPHVRIDKEAELLSNLEREITEGHPQPVRSKVDDMSRMQELLKNGVTEAHEQACDALDKALGDARDLVSRLERAVEAHKQGLREEGQRIAVKLEAAMQELNSAVAWVEKQAPGLRDPKLESKKKKELPPPSTDETPKVG